MIEDVILQHLATDESYARRVVPYLLPEYFTTDANKLVHKIIVQHLDEYRSLPSRKTLAVAINNASGLSEDTYKEAVHFVTNLEADSTTSEDWLVDQTEQFCKDRAIYLAIMESVNIIDGKVKDKDRGAIPQVVTKALAVSFDSHLGHDYFRDAEQRWETRHKKENKIPFKLDLFNKITKGGLKKKTLNVFVAGVNVGKSLLMCDMAAHNLEDNRNVLYITLEMAEDAIADRIDMNLLRMTDDELEEIPKDVYLKRVKRVWEKVKGRLVVHEYPTGQAGTNHFRHLLHELKLKEGFVPDIIYIDYINICASMRYKSGANVNSYERIKSIAEELRGLGVEMNVPIVTATQLTREGSTSSDVDMTDTAESFGLPATADFMLALISSDELEEMGQYMCKQLKNRYDKRSRLLKFFIGVDRDRMTVYDLADSAAVLEPQKRGPHKPVDPQGQDDAPFKRRGKPSLEGFS